MSLPVQFYTLLAMIGMGSLFGATLDTYQRFLKRGKRKKWIVFLNDLLFWFIQGIIIFYVLFLVNYGELRFYLFLALLCGFSAYQALFKKIYLKLLESLIQLVKAVARLIYRTFYLLVYKPARGLCILLAAIILYVYGLLLSLVKIVWIMVKWVLKTVFKPFVWILKKVIPESVEKFVVQLRKTIAGYLKGSKNTIIKVMNFFRKKR
ncbi:spore cortex biosynthesis protein YabQ [Siminovitchia fortis]|uniref:Spore cortex biosynthesis protein YabQ n=1 Tax=Siminovitchia fortis TaxID=254758 RepID=A0A443IJJ4_9BACI|nr:spore cortex biosynthesis protein YabQ [Siminovitchia fortis]RWR04717.1 spore cortex biosynthesis protein YabQ [Siminovitchia fortis]WHY81322.1 spore cortex biosynthesis protein YabQ [Siminovitchia fortis]